tara:strand:- start:95 stop:346 length:252 start_codon:yes stop_codon:yes gene_type:complete
MKVRVTFNDGKNFSHYALVVFKVGLNITYVCSGVLMFGAFFMNASEHIKELDTNIIQEMQEFYFPSETDTQEYIDCMNCDEID